MKFTSLLSAAGLAMLPTAVNAAFDKNSDSNLVLYWGQASAGSEQSLGDYCDKTAGDVYVVSFLNNFGSNSLSLDISGCSSTFSGSTLLHCPDIGKDIKHCQKAGKKVLLSLGGAAGSYGFSGDSDGEQMADKLWDTFGGGKADQRPFDDAIVDGFDLDIENNNQKGYSAMVKKLRQHYDSDSSRDYYVSAAPQCVFPDANVGEALENSDIDFAFIQFYNNPCAVGKSGFNYDTWKNFAETKSPNKDIKLFLGLPGSSSAASSGYVDPNEVAKTLAKIQSDSHFGGVMVWDASQAFGNQVDGGSFASSMQNYLSKGGSSSGGGDSSGSSAAPESSSTNAPTSSAPGVPGESSSAAAPGESSSPGAPAPASSPAVTSSPAWGAPSSSAAAADSASSAGAPASGPQTSIVATLTSKNLLTSTGQPGATSSAATPASSAAAPAGGAAAAGAGGPMQTVTPDDASGACSGQKGQQLADCINTGKGIMNQGNNKQAINGGKSGSRPSSSAAASASGTSSAAQPQDTGASSCSCTDGQFQCQGDKFAMCNFGKWVTFDCAPGTTCKALASGENAVVGCTWA